ncbi:methyltransferase domain-containing protein [bacterium]|nr:methyltransferase domain-containing protein [bacterium]
MAQNWQIKIFQKSLKKKQRVAKICTCLPDLGQKLCLELGCARGIIGYHLRKRGGQWVSTDTDQINLRAAHSLLGQGILQSDPLKLPFHDEAFDLITALDILEHLEDDESCIEEICRLVKTGGTVLVSAPVSGRFFSVNTLKNMIGLTPDVYGHVREGYDPEQLASRLTKKGLHVQKIETFTHFFTEIIETIINFGYIRILSRGHKVVKKRDGSISPSSEQELKKNMKTFKVYSVLYPLTWFFSKLDYLLYFQKGYTLLIKAVKK